MNYIFPKGAGIQISEHFRSSEFDCPCKRPDCDKTVIAADLLAGLERLRYLLARPITITSGFRCQGHNEDLKARGFKVANNSQHLLGAAADLKVPGRRGHQLETAARKSGFMAVGRAQFWIHVDVRSDQVRSWTY